MEIRVWERGFGGFGCARDEYGVSKGPRVWMPCEESVWEWFGYGV